MAETARADVALAARGLARSRTEGAALIRAGQVLLDGRPVRRPSDRVAADATLRLRDPGPRYVSRAAHKLVSALEAFPDVAVAGRRALDAGASTGGFTQVLLERGAERVAAVDVGHDQLAPTVRADPRVLVREGLNVRDLTAEDIDGPVDLVVSDLSFISLRLVLAPLAGVCRPGAELLLMVKPQFEVGRRALPRTGVVTDPDARRDAVVGVAAAALGAGLAPRGLARSGLAGQDGNAEFFLRLRRPDATAADDPAGGTSPAPDAGERAAGWVRGAHIDWS
ncbi:TlyA family RNA methyltransferase [Micrococcus luteus]|nr:MULTISPECIES: TlyA family RNA methyltransferase [Micrococcus]CVN59861.1 rRNA methylase [Streptococcus pneumoniae]EZP37954.1 Hemolysin TlyA family protein [Micrococcus luteus]EZP56922.1 Hemolysin TlyA family protein [Micrococcus luteus]KZE70170.1 16S/23S rRNA (cytidine-2'-O)-methyltransferase [Micrococcus aloeverae]MBU8794163.1 TlyA family RNA methyltransferase [Micrococcus luteus]